MRRLFRTRRGKMLDMPAVRHPLSVVLAECAGNWIAVDRATNELRAAAASADALALEIREKRLRNVAVLRAPDPSEPELVGLG
jgi:hypothetical protein